MKTFTFKRVINRGTKKRADACLKITRGGLPKLREC